MIGLVVTVIIGSKQSFSMLYNDNPRTQTWGNIYDSACNGYHNKEVFGNR